MNCKTKSLLALLLVGVTLIGVTGCKGEKEPAETSAVNAYEYPENYITVPELSSIKLSRADLDKTLNEQIESICSSNRYDASVVVDEAAKRGDKLNISFTGKAADESVTLKEETINGMKGEKTDLVLGSNAFIGAYSDEDGTLLAEGFEDQLIGLKANETKDITVIFPDSYKTEELQGLKVIFTVTVHTVSRLTVDENCLVTVGYQFEQPEGDSNSLEDFQKLFANSSFSIDYSADEDDKKFASLFKIAEYRDLFIGKNKFEEIEAKVTVPDDAAEKYAAYVGKEIKVTFVVNAATLLPEWNDDFIKNYTDGIYTTTAEYEEVMRREITGKLVYDKITDDFTVNEYPKAENEALYNEYVAELIAEQSGKSVEGLSDTEMMKLVDTETYKNICVTAYNYAQQELNTRLLEAYLFKTLQVTLTDEEYSKQLQAGYSSYVNNYMYYYYINYGILFSSISDMENYYGKEALERQFKMNKVLELLPDKVTLTE